MIVRTLVAYCDATDVFPGEGTKDCFESISLDPRTTQVNHLLMELGWTIHRLDEEDGPKVVCPKHVGEVQP